VIQPEVILDKKKKASTEKAENVRGPSRDFENATSPNKTRSLSVAENDLSILIIPTFFWQLLFSSQRREEGSNCSLAGQV
jgi:hypothetical protein